MANKMRASVLYDIGDVRYEMVDIPEITDGEVLVNVKYVGICGSDLPRSMVSGLSGGTAYPLILGHEFSGEVAKIGSKVKNIKVGDRVAVAPLVPCGECGYCKEGNFGLCNDYNIIGTRVNGALAEYVKVPEEHILKLPNTLDYETAAGIEPATIAYHGIAKADIKVGDSVVVLGCGPIGQFALQWAKVFGASKIIAVDIFNEKLELSKGLGANYIVNSKEVNAIEEIKKITNGGADVVIETAGSRFTQEQSLLIAKKRGTIVFVGISHTELPLSAKAAESILRGELTLKGSWNSYTSPYPGRAWTATLDFMGKGDIIFTPMISHKIGLNEVGEFLRKMANREINFNKILVEI
ncbi:MULTISPECIES: galactitol-1-phosphate 5-dehydrogenase [unclassified Clostridioides]|uniref:galactitol-1-phosphate 5-dehydrogenase n=1 Tax=unclassified Clostridioides TaxID=2635829 RepID=UPI001D12A250|nr:galactitol-1-phosphate 5-dehydrogenase [Clostridioides sp. ZZV14-6150]MCC0660328.1 galactitol-1-phosphate 5-dehydrogenase [Clostridioides sp. ZZV14-6154]MCC0667515.1 galactitol-1-phosphate 5-dehydrogenase [Clostridioides sp. ZZV14-6153]MCC0720344.1 galactitol-1-phosphate 5-dehydrogenase [Clostridioides sp. ZZV14-6105]MCC0720872.1 galactitol-1-phosphate 5-dehydrogenase [Clostridioides sp. ZZV14-6104]MCC0728525.1 galactitol-1-phosphate 5-dehydrogenase [Clostridioides sp. ZZV14-6045]MCC073114